MFFYWKMTLVIIMNKTIQLQNRNATFYFAKFKEMLPVLLDNYLIISVFDNIFIYAHKQKN